MDSPARLCPPLTEILEESLPPALVPRAPTELPLDLLVGRAPKTEQPLDEGFAGDEARDEHGYPGRTLGPKGLGIDRQPLLRPPRWCSGGSPYRGSPGGSRRGRCGRARVLLTGAPPVPRRTRTRRARHRSRT